ncbi:MAG: DUF2169 domain-containing protein, partial [Planctomycetota bacterium]
DLVPYKIATDIALLGHAHAPQGEPVDEMAVELEVGSVSKRLRVVGNRQWRPRMGAWVPSAPEPFERMPIRYEYAFGGTDASSGDPPRQAFEPRNPVGKGFRHRPNESLPLPNIEDFNDRIRDWADRPMPQGFGFIARHWQTRTQYAGTHDEHWQAEQCPLLPMDFDYRFFQAAHPDLIAPGYLSGDEPVRLAGLSPDGDLRFSLPAITVGVAVHPRRGQVIRGLARLDTVILRPDDKKVNLVWRSTIPCPRKHADISRVVTFPIRLNTAKRMVSLGHSIERTGV